MLFYVWDDNIAQIISIAHSTVELNFSSFAEHPSQDYPLINLTIKIKMDLLM